MNAPPPLVLVPAHGRVLIGRDAAGVLHDPAELHGAVQVHPTGPGSADVRVARVVQPIEGLVSIVRLEVEGPRIPLADLSRDEQRDIERHYDACQEMLGALRAQQAGIVLPRLVLPDGARRG